jgi:type VI secretion system secreted protein VgrG
MTTWSRRTAMINMSSPLGDDTLIPISLAAKEHISEPYTFDVRAVCQQGLVDPDTLLYQPCCITLQSNGEPIRYFHGIVQSISAVGSIRGQDVGEHQMYHLTLVPRLWFLNQTLDCRVYQKLTTVAILEQLFDEVNLTDRQLPPPGNEREYTVQFNETDLHFVTRLMEEEGYFYFFEHTARSHKLVVTNQNAAFTDISGATMHVSGGESDATGLLDWSRPTGTVRGKMKFRDYDPTKPDTLLQAERSTTLKTGGVSQRDDFRWPALSFDNGTVSDRANRQVEAAEASASLFEGATRFGKFVPGGKFRIESRPPPGPYDNTYVLRSVFHQASDETWLNQDAAASYINHFTAFPASVTWRQPLATPRPRMEGIHTALVLGSQHGKDADIKSQDGEEIYTDELARVKVRFYWDHRREAAGGDAVWARVIQPWAGKGWGAQFIPRVGTEVAVAFVDGDPDRPIVVGGLYNGRDTPIYNKADKTKSGFRTRSSLKGGSSDFNEYSFDDKAGSELIYEQAQKDLKTYIKNDQTLTIDNCRIVTVKQDETVDIQNNQTIKVKQDHSLTVTNGNRSIVVSEGNNSLSVDQGNHDVKVAMGNHTTDVQMGNVSLKADLGQISSEALQSIQLKVGESSITIDQMGVTIKGMMISIEGQIQTQLKGLMTQVNADAMLQIQGAITMIN